MDRFGRSSVSLEDGDDVWRICQPHLVAILLRLCKDMGIELDTQIVCIFKVYSCIQQVLNYYYFLQTGN